MPYRASLLTVVAAALLTAACGNVTPAAEPTDQIEPYFAEFANAWSSGDPYDIARFYDTDVIVREIHPDLELNNPAGYADTTSNGIGRAWLASWLNGRRGAHPTTLDGLFVGSTGAAALLAIEDLNAAVLLDVDIRDGGVTEQLTLRWRDAHKESGVPDDRLASVDQLVDDYVAAWSGESPNLIQRLYTAGAVLERFPDSPVEGRSRLASSIDRLALPEAMVKTVASGSQGGSAVFVFAGAEPETIAMVVEHARAMAVSLRV